MRAVHLSWILPLTLALPVSADEPLPPTKLAQIKRATVFVKVEVRDLIGSGSGFVVHKDQTSAIIITNLHVIEPKLVIEVESTPSRPIGPRGMKGPRSAPLPSRLPTHQTIVTTLKNAKVTVVFDSGTKSEQSAKAEVIAADPANDLAALRVSDVENLPVPLDALTVPELAETMPVYTFGFPFGQILSTSKGFPAITVGKANISSLREDDDGELALVQIDGALNPGNSGGPIMDVKGRIVGVAVATIKNSSGIGLAIPGRQLAAMMQGRLGPLHVATAPRDGKIAVNVEVGAVDPLGKIASVDLYYRPIKKGEVDPKSGSIADLTGVRKTAVTFDKQLGTAQFTLEGGSADDELLVKAVYVSGAKKPLTTKIGRHSLSATALAATNTTPNGAGPAKVEQVRLDGDTRIVPERAGEPFRDEAPRDALLVGLEIGFTKIGARDVLNAVRPIYRSASGESLGKFHGPTLKSAVAVKAKDGYAVGGVTVKSGLWVESLKIRFMRIAGARLDPADSYESEWIGASGGSETALAGDGAALVGVIGRTLPTRVGGFGVMVRKSN